jgi:uncharacterized lipoprotein YajG
MKRQNFRNVFLKGLRWTIPWLVLAGCAHSQDQVALTPERKSEAQSIERAQSEDRLTPMGSDLQKDALRHHINF